MIRLLLFLLVFVPLSMHSQGFINLSRKQVMRELEKQISKADTIQIQLNESDSSIAYLVRDPKLQPGDFIYMFDDKNKCVSEIKISSCDSCHQKTLATILRNGKYDWQKLNDRTYVSSYSKRLMLEMPQASPFTIVINRMKWNRRSYS
ncbi:MAG: hypothetical protein H7Y42_18025, partial [Chitinophagaceae bacterium]|nr:hypothetical protein [Chitinophagaceae bacterium]